MFVESIRRGEVTELLSCSNNKENLRKKMRKDIKDFIEGVYGEDWEEEAEWLTKPEDVKDFWSDKDDEYETVFQINEVEEI
jgi:hypothetical protein